MQIKGKNNEVIGGKETTILEGKILNKNLIMGNMDDGPSYIVLKWSSHILCGYAYSDTREAI